MDNNFLDNIPQVTRHLLIINVLCWIATFALPKIGIDMYELFALHFWKATDFHAYQFVSYMFMHSPNISHIFFNMFALYMFGGTLERVMGPKIFLLFYMLTGVGAGLIQELAWMYDLNPAIAEYESILSAFPEGGVNVGNQVVYSVDAFTNWFHADFSNRFQTVGASGSVFGLLVAFSMLFPDVPMYFMFIPVPIKAKYMMIGYALMELFLGVHNFSWDNVAHFAHLGGALVGFLLILYLKKSNTLIRR